MLMAERTPGRDWLRRHRLHGRRDILAAPLALNHHALGAFRSGEHEASIGEEKAKVIHNFSGSETRSIISSHSGWAESTKKPDP
jgi:hypothetical protein